MVRLNVLGDTIRDVHKLLLNREKTVTKLCQESLNRIDQIESLNPFITVCRSEAIKNASQLDQRISEVGPEDRENALYGIPISIKDNFCTRNILTTCGSRMLHNYIPPYDATVVSKLIKANCIMMGKTNMDEFAMGSSSTTSFYGPTANYSKRELLKGQSLKDSLASNWFMAGGSSTGSAISVSSGACFASLGTDTGGSTRQPASLTGVVGFKPSYGLISRFGLVPLAHCLDVVSIIARCVDDVKLIFDAIAGQDEHDLTTVDHKTVLKSSLSLQNLASIPTIRIGIPDEFVNKGDMSSDVSKVYDETLSRISSKDPSNNIRFELKKLSLPHSSLATECYTIISSAEIASNMSCYDGVKYGLSLKQSEDKEFNRDEFFRANRDAGFGPEVKKRILLGNFFLLSGNREKYLDQALKVRRLISDEFDKCFAMNEVDVILLPSTPTTSVSYKDWLAKQDEDKLFREDYFLIPANLANLPSISLPAGLSSKRLPLGLQLIANKYCDLDLLSVSKLFEAHVLKDVNQV